MKPKQPIFIASKKNIFEAWLIAKRRADKARGGRFWGRFLSEFKVLQLLQDLPEKIQGYVTVAEINKAIEPMRCHYCIPGADSGLNSILYAIKPLREKLDEVVADRVAQEEARPKGLFHALFKAGNTPKDGEFGYVLRHKDCNE